MLCPQRTHVCQYVGARGKFAVVALNVLLIDGILNLAENWRFGSLGGARTLFRVRARFRARQSKKKVWQPWIPESLRGRRGSRSD